MEPPAAEDDVDSYQGSFYVPADEGEWEELVSTKNLRNHTINTIEKMRSGSKPFKKQFLMLKAVWPRMMEIFDFEERLADYGLDIFWEEAHKVVAGSFEVQRYLALIADPTKDNFLDERSPHWAGSFMPVFRLQQKCAIDKRPQSSRLTRASKRKRSSEEAQPNPGIMQREVPDENIVNAALVLLLEAMNYLIANPKSDWTLDWAFALHAAGYKDRATNESSRRLRIDLILGGCITEQKKLPWPRDTEVGFWLSTETALGINVKYKMEDRFLNGCADYTLWYDNEGPETHLSACGGSEKAQCS